MGVSQFQVRSEEEREEKRRGEERREEKSSREREEESRTCGDASHCVGCHRNVIAR